MNEKSCDQSSLGPQQGAPAEAGKHIEPSDIPLEEAPDEGSDKRDKKDIPIGRPISDEEYQKLKEEAEKANPPPAGSAQEDI
ncbi:MAG: hypothetical protein ACREAB_02255 [Blastocatellia bacterium]